MAQSTILAAAQTAATSSDVTVAAGSVAKVGLFVSSGNIPAGLEFPIMEDTPGADSMIGSLNANRPSLVIAGPGTYRVKRNLITAAGVDVGVFSET